MGGSKKVNAVQRSAHARAGERGVRRKCEVAELPIPCSRRKRRRLQGDPWESLGPGERPAPEIQARAAESGMKL